MKYMAKKSGIILFLLMVFPCSVFALPKWETIYECSFSILTPMVHVTSVDTIQTRYYAGMKRYRSISQLICNYDDLDDNDNCIPDEPQPPKNVVGSIKGKRAIFRGKEYDLRFTMPYDQSQLFYNAKHYFKGGSIEGICVRSKK